MTVTAAALQELVEMSRLELATADGMLDRHQPLMYGLCQCNRVWPCSVAAEYGKAARYLRTQLAILEPRLALVAPTLQLPEVRR